MFLTPAYLMCIFLLLFGCASSSEKRVRAEGKKIVKELFVILRDVENHEELQAATPYLKKKFNRLANLLLEIRSLQEKNRNIFHSNEPLEGSEVLFAELARLYEIPGCREIVEQAESEAVYHLLTPK